MPPPDKGELSVSGAGLLPFACPDQPFSFLSQQLKRQSAIPDWGFGQFFFGRLVGDLQMFFGSLRVMGELWRISGKILMQSRRAHREKLDRVARRFDLSFDEIQALGQLHSKPITQRVYRIVREFWLDRLMIAGLMVGGTVALALVPIPLWIKLMVPLSSFPLLFFLN